MAVHALREASAAGPVLLCKIACSDDSFKTEPGRTFAGFASGWSCDVTCRDCLNSPVAWSPWKRMAGGEVRNFGTVHLIPTGGADG